MLLQYIILVVCEWIIMRAKDKQLKNTIEDERDIITSTKRRFLNLILTQFVFVVILLVIPSRSFAIRCIIQGMVDSAIPPNDANIMIMVGSFTLLTDFVNSAIFFLFMQNVYPLEKYIPWC